AAVHVPAAAPARAAPGVTVARAAGAPAATAAPTVAARASSAPAAATGTRARATRAATPATPVAIGYERARSYNNQAPVQSKGLGTSVGADPTAVTSDAASHVHNVVAKLRSLS